MEFLRQVWGLTLKNILHLLVRRWFTTPVRALVLPVIFVFIFSWSKHWVYLTVQEGVGTPYPIRTLPEAFADGSALKNKFVIVDNGFKTGDIAEVVHGLSSVARNNGMDVHVLKDASEIPNVCPGSVLGVTSCFGGVQFIGSPDHHSSRSEFLGIWDYTVMTDASATRVRDVNSNQNGIQIYLLPLQHAIDDFIGKTHGGSGLPPNITAFAYTMEKQSYDTQQTNSRFQGNLANYLAVAVFVGMLGITYHLPGFMALEREKGLSQLIEAMMPNKQRWQPQVARILSYHLAFDLIYLPGWFLISIVIGVLVFPATNLGIIILWHILSGLSLTSYSIFAASMFRKAQLSGITIVVISFALAVAAQFGFSSQDKIPTYSIYVTAALFPPMTYIYFLLVLVGFQVFQEPASLSAYPKTVFYNWKVNGATLLGMMLLQFLIFPFLAIFLERAVHGTSCRRRKLVQGSKGVATWTENFSKHYKTTTIWGKIFCFRFGSRARVVKAVNNLSLQFVRGSITVLLGANGSGKTTTLSAIAGTTKTTAGAVYVDGTGGLGLCPQRNVLWDDLTVYEHVMIFDLLKSGKGSCIGKAGRQKLIDDCDLRIKLHAKSKTLSGGQKRKLQLAMMFVGGSRVCCVDEVSSGIDPLARRKIWDILLAERGRRTIILTTHFMDEADIIADHVAIMSKGSLKAEGSAAELKHALGNGFEVIIPLSAVEFLQSRIPHLKYRNDRGHAIIRASESGEVATIINNLEFNGIFDYHVQSPTMEDVFLSIAEEIEGNSTLRARSDSSLPINSQNRTGEELSPLVEDSSKKILKLSTGRDISFIQQVQVLLRKRFVVLRTQYFSYPTAILLPILTAYLVTYFLKTFPYPDGIPCSNYHQDQLYPIPIRPFQLSHDNAVYGPPNTIPLEKFIGLFEKYNIRPPPAVNSLEQFNQYIRQKRFTLGSGGFYDTPGAPVFAYASSEYVVAGPVVQFALNNVLLGASQLILPKYEQFSAAAYFGSFQSILLVLFMGLALCVYPAILGLYPSLERVNNVRALQYTNGIRSAPIWVAHILFDFMFVVLISVACVGVWVSQYTGWYNIGCIALIFILFGLASTAFTYCVSLFAKSPLACFAFASALQCAALLLAYAGYLLTEVYAPADQTHAWDNYEYFTIALISPTASLLRALLSSLNEFSLLCRGKRTATFPAAIDIYGGPILYLTLQIIAFMAFAIYWDGGGRFNIIRRLRRDVVMDYEDKIGADVLEDPSRLNASNDGLRVLNMSKSFGDVQAVENLSLGVRKWEAFALLGPNGAGKSTLISLIRGDIRQTGRDGDIFISGQSLEHHRASARSHLGTCPQFDAIDSMTVVEHLRFYARARGVDSVDRNVSLVMEAVGLSPYKKRLAGDLSGGNKRKLSLAISLVGNPSVLILDEPSSGMDAAAKRVMWRVLGALSAGRALVITTHSMEEADTLCQRAGIMAGRMLALGTTEELRNRYSDSSYVHLVHKEAPHTSQEHMEALRQWILQEIPEAVMERRTFGGQLRFSVRNGSPLFVDMTSTERCTTGSLFRFFERQKEHLQISQYTVGSATLDQVFLSVISQHNVQEENYMR